jgi:hypothetical protein
MSIGARQWELPLSNSRLGVDTRWSTGSMRRLVLILGAVNKYVLSSELMGLTWIRAVSVCVGWNLY